MSDGLADGLVLFGITGDLAYKKLFPALYQLYDAGRIKGPLIGVASSEWTIDQLRDRMHMSVSDAGMRVDPKVLDGLTQALSYISGNYEDPTTFDRLNELLTDVQLPVCYLAIPPSLFPACVEGLSRIGVTERGRLVLEKPFGRDLESAIELNKVILDRMSEDRVYRIDHFLGKEPVLNLLVARFANSLLEPVWNRRQIAHIEITMGETFGVETRGKFYDNVGALRDVVQNHLLQVVSLMAMEPPVSEDADALRDEHTKVLRATRVVDPAKVVRGQYEGYLHEDGVAPDSETETFVALELAIDTWRWAGVPFHIRAGKALPMSVTEAIVVFHDPPKALFAGEGMRPEPNRIRFRLNPDGLVRIEVQAKVPGDEMKSATVHLDLHEGGELDLAYERLLGDVFEGDQRLFARQDTVEAAWRVVQPVLDAPSPVQPYAKGTWGPKAALDMLPDDHDWIPCTEDAP
jgi:glucose-6-phosphate 1-dehydrogenase